MKDIDNMVKKWLLSKFKSRDASVYNVFYNTPDDLHLVNCPEARVRESAQGWECDCMSEFTRGDVFQFRTVVDCPHGKVSSVTLLQSWDLPDFVKELDEYMEFNCPYDEW